MTGTSDMNVYVWLERGAKVDRTEEISSQVSLDYSEAGELVGIEIISAAGVSAECEP